MLSPVIMIGCGGSGSKAVRYARDAVTRRLREVGWTAPMPGAWTFLGLDFNNRQEATAEIPPLPENDFVALSLHFNQYHGLYDTLLGSSPPDSDRYRQHLLGWLPERGADVGAGQRRAVGRAAGLRALANDEIRDPLNAAFVRAVNPNCIKELGAVSKSLTGSGDDEAGKPIVLVCAAMAGGTGAGIALDVVDLLRRIYPAGRNPFLLLFANDIFGDDQRPNMAGNSMAFLSELLSGYWNDDADSLGPGDFFEHNQMNPGHGPSSVFVVSSKGLKAAGIGDSNIAVYRAVGEALSGWATDSQVQTKIQAWAIGNVAARAEGNDGGYPFSVSQPGVVSSFGAAVVTVGRVRFQRWAQDLLSRAIMESLKSGHRRRQDPEEAEAERIETMALNYWRVVYGDEFPERVPLEVEDWKGLARTEEVFLPGNTRSRDDIIGKLEGSIAGAKRMAPEELVANLKSAYDHCVDGSIAGSKRMAPEEWVANLKSAYDHCVDDVISEAEDLPSAKVSDWSASTVEHMSKSVSYVLARTSCAVAIKCVDECDTFLEAGIKELEKSGARDVESAEAELNKRRQTLRMSRGILGLHRNKSAVKGVFDATVELLVQRWYAARHGVVIELYKFAISELNAGIRQSLEQIRESVDAVFEPKRGVEPSEVLGWPKGIDQIPVQYLPSNIELPLESEDEWNALLGDLCRRHACTSLRKEELPMDAARILLVEGDDTARVSPFVAADPAGPRWRPGDGGVSFFSGADSAGVSDRVQSWMYDNFSDPLREGFDDYLTDGRGHVVGGVPVNYAARRTRFKKRLDEAVSLAQPLVEVDEALCGLVYSDSNAVGLVVDVECSQLPFGVNHECLVDAKAVFAQHFGDETARQLTLRGSDTSSILITAFISNPLHPMVITSITDPIAETVRALRDGTNRDQLRTELWSWKRARTLLHAVALPPEAMRAMIRGFAIARLCGYITVSRFEPIKISGSPEPGDDREEVEFPWPFLSLLKKNSEILPALLESFVQCYAEVGTRSLDAFEAYRRLFKLGDRNDPDYLCDVEQMLQGQDLPCKCLTPPKVSKGADIAERRKQAITYLDRNIEFFLYLENVQLTGQESRTDEGYAVGDIHDVALREILPLARECYEEVVRDVGKI